MDCSTRPPCPSQLPEFTQTHVHWVGDTIQPPHPLSPPSPPALNLSQHQNLFKWVSSSHQVAKILEFQFQHQSSNEYSGLIFFRMDWLDLLAVQGTLKSLLQHHSSKVSILRCSAFFRVQLSHPYMTTGKTIALTRWMFVGKVMSLLFNMLSRLVIAFLPRIRHLLISWLQSPSAVILEPPKIKSATVCSVSPSVGYEAMGPDAMTLGFWMLSFKPTFFPLLFHFYQEAFEFFAFYCKGGVICISEVIDISPGNLDSSLCFFQPSVSHDALCIEVKEAEWRYTALTCHVPIPESSFLITVLFNFIKYFLLEFFPE